MTRDVTTQTTQKTDGPLSLPARTTHTVTPAAFKKQCDDVVAFCYHAHEVSVDSALRCGVSPTLIDQLRLERPHTFAILITELSCGARKELLDRTAAAIKVAAPGHTGSFPDFIGYARSVSARFDRFVTERLDPAFGTLPSDNTGDPAVVANTLGAFFSIALATQRHMEQSQTALVLIAGLAAYIRQSLPDVSVKISDARSRILEGEAHNPIPYNRR